jgi:hypothetical protein
MALSKDNNGYLRLSLNKNGKKYYKRLHKLVSEAFHGPCPKGLLVRHLDGNRENCHEDNLQIGTLSENAQDVLNAEGYISGRKLNEDVVRKIRKGREEGLLHTELADLYGVTPRTIRDVVDRRTWKGVE